MTLKHASPWSSAMALVGLLPAVDSHAAPPKFRFESTPQFSFFEGPSQASNTLAGDFDGDGIPDLLSRGQVLLNRGFGSFTPSAGGIGVGPIEDAIGDFDNDGDLDIAASAHGVASAVLVYANLGDGTFGAPTSYPSIDPLRLVSGDFDQDGKADILVYTYDLVGLQASIQVLLNANGLVASPPQAAPIGDAVLGVGDFDGDGTADVAISAFGLAHGVFTMRGLGGGVFASPLPAFATPGEFILVADLDHDGRSDLVVNEDNGSPGTTRILLATVNGFTSSQSINYINTSNSPTQCVVADFNSDQNPDLLTLILGAPPQLRYGNKHGFFGIASNVDLGGMWTAAAMHLDGNGLIDLVVVGALGVYGLFSQSPGTFVLPPTTGVPTTVNSAPLLHDVDGDAKVDLLVNDGGSIRFQKGAGDGSFGPTVLSPSELFPWLVPVNSNNDGNVDLVVAGTQSFLGSIATHLGVGNGAFVPPPTTTNFLFLKAPPVPADIDNDGDDDLFALTAFDVNLCTASPGPNPYATSTAVVQSTGLGSLAAADFDLDGFIDFVVSTNSVAQSTHVLLYPYLGNGAGTFSPGPSSIVTPIVLAPDLQFSTARDFDNDGDMDLCLLSNLRIFQLSYGANGFSVVTENSGIGSFVIQPAAVHFGDLDADGFTDVAVGGTIVPGTANGFDPAESNALVNFGWDTNPSSNGILYGSDLADLNGDGRTDAVVGHSLGFVEDFAILIQDKCVSAAAAYGSGCPGSGGFSPVLTFTGCPDPGETVKLGAKFGLGGATMVVLLGTSPANLPIGGGCRLLLFPVLPQSLLLPLAGGGAGNGSFSLPTVYPASAVGLNLAMQGFVVDPGATLGYAATNGIQLLH